MYLFSLSYTIINTNLHITPINVLFFDTAHITVVISVFIQMKMCIYHAMLFLMSLSSSTINCLLLQQMKNPLILVYPFLPLQTPYRLCQDKLLKWYPLCSNTFLPQQNKLIILILHYLHFILLLKHLQVLLVLLSPCHKMPISLYHKMLIVCIFGLSLVSSNPKHTTLQFSHILKQNSGLFLLLYRALYGNMLLMQSFRLFKRIIHDTQSLHYIFMNTSSLLGLP